MRFTDALFVLQPDGTVEVRIEGAQGKGHAESVAALSAIFTEVKLRPEPGAPREPEEKVQYLIHRHHSHHPQDG